MRRGIVDGLYGVLLRSFPAHHRARYGREMRDAFRSERRSVAHTRGWWSVLRYVAAAYVDAALSGWRERGRQRERLAWESTGLLAGIRQDMRHTVRTLGRSWTFTIVCLLSLGIGIGINAALAVLMHVTFAPPAAVDAEGAVELIVLTHGANLNDVWSYPDFEDVKRADTGMDVTGWLMGTRHLRAPDDGDAVRLSTMYTSANYFEALGVRVARGRAFLPAEDVAGGDPPAIISHDMWQNRLGGADDVVGSVLNLNGTLHRVAGVAPPGFRGHRAGYGADVWLPLWTHPLLGPDSDFRFDRGADGLQVIGRLREGTSMATANGAVAAVMRGLAEAHPGTNEVRSAAVVPYTWQGGGTGEVALARLMFTSLSGLLLLVVCLNVSGMVLVRSASRERELALRMALGSTRARLVRYLMTESALIAVLGGALSIAASVATLHVLSLRSGMPFPTELLPIVLAVCIGLALVSMLAIGVSPALRFTRPELLVSVKDDSGAGGRRSSRVHRVATSVQTALALPLLVITGMVLQATRVMDEADYGFDPVNLFVATMDLDLDGYALEEIEPFLREVRTAVSSLPGVTSVSVADAVPLDYVRRSRRLFRAGEDEYMWVQGTRASEGYFETIGTPILRGRDFEQRDGAGAEPVAIITESLARSLWPDGDALGQRVRYPFDRSTERELTVVGIVADVAGASHESDPTNIFVSLWQVPTSPVSLVVRGESENAAIARAVQDMILRLDPDVTRPIVTTSRRLMEQPKADMYAGSIFVGGISALTLLLAALGVYGVVAFAVANRTREIGVRMAMGATRLRVVAMVLGDGTKLVLPGIVVGAILAGILAHVFLASWYNYLGLATINWLVLSGSAAGALAVVLVATSMPARRAASVQPMAALRSD